MKRSVVVTIGVICVGSGGLVRGQTGYPFIAELKQNYGIVKNNMVRMAEKMPEEHYGFKPVNGIRSFGESIAHVADSQARSCSLVKGGEPRLVDAASKAAKTELVAALKESYAICDAVFDVLTDATAAEMVRLGQSARERSKLGLLAGVISHSNEQYGYMSVYLRLKGVVPPSSEGQ
jgi:uncharacterized damage-inducible protein DinB